MVLYTKQLVVSFDENKDEVYNRVLDFFNRMCAYSGEQIMQNDKPQFEAPQLMADLADEVFKFKVEYL